MTHATIRRTAPALLLAAFVGLTACTTGSDPDDTAPTSTAAGETTSTGPTAAEPTSDEPSDEAEDGAYVDRDGFSIVFPPDWTTRTDAFGLQVFGTPPTQLADDFADNVGVLFEDVGVDSLTLEEYLEASIDASPTVIADFELINLDVDQGTIEYTGSPQDRPLHFLSLVRVKDGKAYTATFTATEETYEAGVADARVILESLQAT